MFDEPKLGSVDANAEALLHLQDDLRTLAKLVVAYRKPLTEADIRTASVILRKWLLDGGSLGRLCREVRAKATFPTLDNGNVIQALREGDQIDYFVTGGIKFSGKPCMGFYHSTEAYTGFAPIPVESMTTREVTIGGLTDQKRMFFKGTFFTCADIIGFCANKLGGAHYDLNRAGKYALMNEAYNYIMFGGPLAADQPPPSEMYIILQTEPCPALSGFHIEIAAAAASLMQMKLDGLPLLEFSIKPSWRTKVRRWLGLDKSSLLIYPVDGQ